MWIILKFGIGEDGAIKKTIIINAIIKFSTTGMYIFSKITMNFISKNGTGIQIFGA